MNAKAKLTLLVGLLGATPGFATDIETPPMLLDTSFIEAYQAPDAFDSEAKVKAFRHEASVRMNELKKAFDEASDRCLKAFFVERCVDTQKGYYLERTREIRAQLKRAGDNLLAIRTKEAQETPHHAIPEAKPGELHLIKTPIPDAKPEGLPTLMKEPPKRLTPQEEARNEAQYRAKLAKAQARMDNAQAQAEARRASRIEKREALEAKLRAREEEQKRFEARQNSGDPTGLMRYFQGD